MKPIPIDPPRPDEASTQTLWARVTEIVDEALKRPDRRQRARYLRRACAGDQDLRREVEELLQFEDADRPILAGPLLERPEAENDSEDDGGDDEAWPAFAPGRRLGPYEVQRILGRGGMGVVVLAHDPELDRRVALKLMRQDSATGGLLRRFEAERRILARLDHPHIARIFDAGSADGQPYFAMEYVDGEPIGAYCDRHRWSIRDRLCLVEKVCMALDVAHRHLVVHRDLKPGNLLVTAAGEPKVLDFGIAKEIDPLADQNLTHTGLVPLTPAYASPEQVRGRQVTVATDVYSLGVVLYRLLCGHPPYVLDGDHFENVRTICEIEPPLPSEQARLAVDVWRDGTPETIGPDILARDRASEPQRLRRRLRGDLDSIVLKALAKDPEARYRSMDQFAGDLRRHLEGLPVSARRSTLGYRAVKFARRHRWRLAVAAAMMGMIITASTVWVLDQRRLAKAEAEQRRAVEQAVDAERQADALGDFLRSLLRATDPDATGGRAVTAREILERGQERVRDDLQEQPELLAHQLEAIGLAYDSLGDLEAARSVFDESLRLRREVYGDDHRLVARGFTNLATVLYRLGVSDRATELYEESLEIRRRLGQPEEDLAKAESGLAAILMEIGDFQRAETLYDRLLETRLEAYGSDSPDVANTQRSLGILQYLRGDFEAAELWLRQALDVRIRAFGREHTASMSALSSLGRLFHVQGRHREAEEALVEVLAVRQELLGDGHLHVALTKKDLADLYLDVEEDDVARVLWDQAMAVIHAKKPPGSWEIADAESRLGARLAAAGRLDEAAPCLVDSYETLRRLRGDDAIYTREALRRLALVRSKDLPPKNPHPVPLPDPPSTPAQGEGATARPRG